MHWAWGLFTFILHVTSCLRKKGNCLHSVFNYKLLFITRSVSLFLWLLLFILKEMVLDKENDKVHPRYLAYDILVFQVSFFFHETSLRSRREWVLARTSVPNTSAKSRGRELAASPQKVSRAHPLPPATRATWDWFASSVQNTVEKHWENSWHGQWPSGLRCWIWNPEALGSNRPPFTTICLFSVVQLFDCVM